MKIYMDNQINDFRKIVYIESQYNKNIYDDLNTIIDALKGFGYSEESIQQALLSKCVEYKLIEGIEDED